MLSHTSAVVAPGMPTFFEQMAPASNMGGSQAVSAARTVPSVAVGATPPSPQLIVPLAPMARGRTRLERRKQAEAFQDIVRVNDLEPDSGCAPLHWAVRNGKYALACRLCDAHGAIVDLRSGKEEKTALHFAAEARRDRKRLVRALREIPAPGGLCSEYATALHVDCSSGAHMHDTCALYL